MTSDVSRHHKWYAERRSSRNVQCMACGKESNRHEAMMSEEECPEYDPDRIYFGWQDPKHDWQFLFWTEVSDGIHVTTVQVGIYQCSYCGQYMTRRGHLDESKTYPMNAPTMCDFVNEHVAI